MAPSKSGSNGLCEYEMERNRNLEENRRILESIRREQMQSFGDVLPTIIKKKSSTAEPRPKKKVKRAKPTELKEKKEGEPESDVENEDKGSVGSRRKSARLSGKKPKYSVHGDDGGDSGDEDFDSDNAEDESDDEEFEGRTRKKRSVVPNNGPRPKIVIPKDRPNFYGAVPGIPIGKMWETRMACCADGVQRPTVAGIHAGPEGAYSISLAGGYEDDVDLGDCFTYTGEGGRALKGTKSNPKNLRTAPQSKDQTLTRGNLALSLSIETRKPVRVIRGANLNNEFAPEYGYRYDGLYTVEKYWSCIGKSGFKVYKFALSRCPNQAPPPWVAGIEVLPETGANSADSAEDEDDEDRVEKPTVLKVKLFNK